jgi:hypothetical protein
LWILSPETIQSKDEKLISVSVPSDRYKVPQIF